MPEIGTANLHTLQPIQFSESGIQIPLQNLIANKSPGSDEIHLLVLKHCSYDLAPILKVIFTQSLNTGSIPSDWLLANITPVYNKGNKNLPVNYHPISLTSVCSKVVEHVIYHSIMSHLNRNNVLSGSQHGFRTGYSWSTQLVLLIEDLNFHMDYNVQVDMVLLKFSKRIEKWLVVHKQHVLLDGASSEYVPVSPGVPQGTLLRQMMFMIYIN